ncbi:MAG TPA: hypothetical protein VJL38_00175 [Patescibacteria group bacterium]|nr:hypothetical protein [Patescibacteria group bacterium]
MESKCLLGLLITNSGSHLMRMQERWHPLKKEEYYGKLSRVSVMNRDT